MQDTLSESVEHPELAEHYDPAKDSLMLACEAQREDSGMMMCTGNIHACFF